MSRIPRQLNHLGGRVEPILFKPMSTSKKHSPYESKSHSLQMTSRSTVLSNSNAFIELSQTKDTLECIREEDGGHGSQHPTTTRAADLFTVPTNQQKSRTSSPVSSDYRWGLVDDESREHKAMYKRICLMMSVVCFISIGALLLTALMLVGYLGSSTGCGCSTSTRQEPRQSAELQKQIKEMDQMERNVSEITDIMRKQKEEMQRLWLLLETTREELQQLKPTIEIPVSMTTEKTKPTTPSSLNTTNISSSVTPSNTPFVDPIEIAFTQLWTAHNDSVQEIAELNFKVRNISLIPGPMGPTGRDGPRGPPGSLGPIGRPGENGTRGPAGPRGPMGLQGYNGTKGPTGQQGPPGARGPKGNQGPQGLQGPMGPRGYNGTRGPPGPAGATGLQGNPGNTGPRGPQGLLGAQGPVGPPGPRGAGNFSQCVYKRADSTGVPKGSSSYDTALVTEPAGRRIIGAVCSTNNAQETMFESQLRPDGRKYLCSCIGLSNHFNRGDATMYCYIHYWECPLST